MKNHKNIITPLFLLMFISTEALALGGRKTPPYPPIIERIELYISDILT